MKKIVLLSVFLYAISFFASSQIYSISDGTGVVNDMARPCISITFEPSAKDAAKAWKDFLKKKYDFKLKSDKKDDLKAEEAMFPAVTSRTMDFFTKFEKNKDDNTTTMNVFISYGYDIFLNKADNPSEHSALMTIMKEFSLEFLREHYNKGLEELNAALAKIEKNKSKTISENENLANTIEKNKQTIIDLTKENEEKTALIETNKKTIETLKEDVIKKKEEIQKMNNVINGIK
ncbi:MAG: hypothetical protein L3J35_00805 [Bacteroidales bacterium]|nr:hypothetical protein [Bacteroidales bacterium]